MRIHFKHEAQARVLLSSEHLLARQACIFAKWELGVAEAVNLDSRLIGAI